MSASHWQEPYNHDGPNQLVQLTERQYTMKGKTMTAPIIPLYDYDANNLELLDEEGTPWFLAKNVCKALGLDDVEMALEYVEPEHKEYLNGYAFVSEIGFYSIILNSLTPEALSWQSFLLDEVLPHYKETGEFPNVQERYQDIVKVPPELLARFEELPVG